MLGVDFLALDADELTLIADERSGCTSWPGRTRSTPTSGSSWNRYPRPVATLAPCAKTATRLASLGSPIGQRFQLGAQKGRDCLHPWGRSRPVESS